MAKAAKADPEMEARPATWSTIPARRIETLTDEELRAIEIEENSERLALADFESSKARLAEIRQAEADAKAEAELNAAAAKTRPKRARFPSPGREVRRGRLDRSAT